MRNEINKNMSRLIELEVESPTPNDGRWWLNELVVATIKMNFHPSVDACRGAIKRVHWYQQELTKEETDKEKWTISELLFNLFTDMLQSEESKKDYR